MALAFLFGNPVQASRVVINEIHYNPDVKTERIEFVELYNSGTEDIDLTGWAFSDGIAYPFPPETILPARAYTIVVCDLAAVLTRWNSPRQGAPVQSLHGPFEGKLDNEGEKLILRNQQGEIIDQVDYELGFPWPTVGDAILDNGQRAGSGYSIQLIHPALDNNQGGNWRSDLPTPDQKNEGVYAHNAAPFVRQVQHLPAQPMSGEGVTVTAKVTDPDGISSVFLSYQIVEPGSYVRLTDTQYERNWIRLDMHDNGLQGDAIRGNSLYSVTLPATLQRHRRLIRYRIVCVDGAGVSCAVPYSDDPQPNFAYFVYDGVPAWKAAIKPGDPGPLGQVMEFGTEVMRSLPVYHLIAQESDVLNSQYNGAFNSSEYDFLGTFIYDGRVYDHMRYRIRGQNSTYVTGKNKWKLRFNRGHYFQCRDDAGTPHKTQIKTLNLGSLSSPWGPQNRGMAGMDEALAFRLFNMVGVPAYNTTWFQFRIIDTPHEVDPASQYNGDLWGLYLAFENPNGRFLDAHDLPDGNVYKMQGAHRIVNQGPTQPTDKSDLTRFISGSSGYNRANPIQPLSWWQAHVNLEAYYSYRSVVEVVNHSDIRDQENSVYYHHPETDQWWMLPWDLDLLYEEFQRWGPLGIQSASRLEQFRKVLQHPEANIAFTNRARELQDLLFNRDQLWQLIDELAAMVEDPNLPASMADVDHAMWENHPRTRNRFGFGPGQFYRTPFPGQDIYNGFTHYQRVLPSSDFAGMVQFIKAFVVAPGHGGTLLNALVVDSGTPPKRPDVIYLGTEGFPTNDLSFAVNEFIGGQVNDTVAALQWRLAEVEPYSRVVPPVESSSDPVSHVGPWIYPVKRGKRGIYEIDAIWESQPLTDPHANTVTMPASVTQAGHTYRVRCRAQDSTGRWSRWSEPVQFVANEALTQGLVGRLCLTELMYNPAPAGDGTNNDNYEFIELTNISDQTLDLTHVSFEDGILFEFGDSHVTSLDPGQFVLVVADIAAFEARYGPALKPLIAGQYQGKLANGGEHVTLIDTWDGTLVEFDYDDSLDWPALADGLGHSLVPLDTALPNQHEGALNHATNWRASANTHGSPGREDLLGGFR